MAVVDGKKKKTDPGPFTAPPKHPSAEQAAVAVRESSNAAAEEQSPAAADAEPQLPGLYRFQEIPVTDELRRELLEAKLPLVSAEQLVDTRPPNRAVMDQTGAAPLPLIGVDRSAPTEPALPRVEVEDDPEPDGSESTEPSSDEVYSATAPTLLNMRNRRMRNWRFVVAALAVVAVALGAWLWVRESLQPSDPGSAVNDRTKRTRHLAGSSPQPTKSAGLARPATDEPALAEHTVAKPTESASDRDERSSPADAAVAERAPAPRPASKVVQDPAPAPAAETLTKLPSRPPGPKSAPRAAPDKSKQAKPASGKKSFDPEELIF